MVKAMNPMRVRKICKNKYAAICININKNRPMNFGLFFISEPKFLPKFSHQILKGGFAFFHKCFKYKFLDVFRLLVKSLVCFGCYI